MNLAEALAALSRPLTTPEAGEALCELARTIQAHPEFDVVGSIAHAARRDGVVLLRENVDVLSVLCGARDSTDTRL